MKLKEEPKEVIKKLSVPRRRALLRLTQHWSFLKHGRKIRSSKMKERSKAKHHGFYEYFMRCTGEQLFGIKDISIEDMEKIFETTASTISCSEECLIDKVGLAENEGGCEHEDLLNSGLPKSFAKTSMDQILEHVPGSSIQSFYFVRKLTKFLLSVPEEFDAKDFGKPKKEHEWFKKKVIGRYFIYNDPQVVDSFDMYYDPDQNEEGGKEKQQMKFSRCSILFNIVCCVLVKRIELFDQHMIVDLEKLDLKLDSDHLINIIDRVPRTLKTILNRHVGRFHCIKMVFTLIGRVLDRRMNNGLTYQNFLEDYLRCFFPNEKSPDDQLAKVIFTVVLANRWILFELNMEEETPKQVDREIQLLKESCGDVGGKKGNKASYDANVPKHHLEARDRQKAHPQRHSSQGDQEEKSDVNKTNQSDMRSSIKSVSVGRTSSPVPELRDKSKSRHHKDESRGISGDVAEQGEGEEDEEFAGNAHDKPLGADEDVDDEIQEDRKLSEPKRSEPIEHNFKSTKSSNLMQSIVDEDKSDARFSGEGTFEEGIGEGDEDNNAIGNSKSGIEDQGENDEEGNELDQIREGNEEGDELGQFGEGDEEGNEKSQAGEGNEEGDELGQVGEGDEEGNEKSQVGEGDEEGDELGQFGEGAEEGNEKSQAGEGNEEGDELGQVREGDEEGNEKSQVGEGDEEGDELGQFGEGDEEGNEKSQAGEGDEEGNEKSQAGEGDEEGNEKSQVGEGDEEGDELGQVGEGEEEENEKGNEKSQVGEEDENEEGQNGEEDAEEGQVGEGDEELDKLGNRKGDAALSGEDAEGEECEDECEEECKEAMKKGRKERSKDKHDKKTGHLTVGQGSSMRGMEEVQSENPSSYRGSDVDKSKSKDSEPQDSKSKRGPDDKAKNSHLQTSYRNTFAEELSEQPDSENGVSGTAKSRDGTEISGSKSKEEPEGSKDSDSKDKKRRKRVGTEHDIKGRLSESSSDDLGGGATRSFKKKKSKKLGKGKKTGKKKSEKDKASKASKISKKSGKKVKSKVGNESEISGEEIEGEEEKDGKGTKLSKSKAKKSGKSKDDAGNESALSGEEIEEEEEKDGKGTKLSKSKAKKSGKSKDDAGNESALSGEEIEEEEEKDEKGTKLYKSKAKKSGKSKDDAGNESALSGEEIEEEEEKDGKGTKLSKSKAKKSGKSKDDAGNESALSGEEIVEEEEKDGKWTKLSKSKAKKSGKSKDDAGNESALSGEEIEEEEEKDGKGTKLSKSKAKKSGKGKSKDQKKTKTITDNDTSSKSSTKSTVTINHYLDENHKRHGVRHDSCEVCRREELESLVASLKRRLSDTYNDDVESVEPSRHSINYDDGTPCSSESCSITTSETESSSKTTTETESSSKTTTEEDTGM